MVDPVEGPVRDSRINTRLRKIAGWAFLAAAFGILLEIIIPRAPGEGTVGLIPLYLGFPVGAVVFVLEMKSRYRWPPAIMAGIGMAGILFFMFAYPNGVAGWTGGFFLAAAGLVLPFPYRFAAVVWTGVGILGALNFNFQLWDLFDTFALFGIATAICGAYLLLGINTTSAGQ